MSERLYIVDGTALVYRSYFSFIRNPLINSKGENTSAAFGFASSILRLIRDEKPDYLVIAFDSKEPTFRHKMYSEYKATREKMPDDLVEQLHRIQELVDVLNIQAIAVPGYEADDIMGTLAKTGYEAGLTVFMVTGDKDLMQMVNDRIYWLNLKKTGQEPEKLDPDGVMEKFGVPPDRVVDTLALMGDSSDNVPGVTGVGPKTAIKLINEYATVENLLDNTQTIKNQSLREKLERDREQALLSKELVTLKCDMPLDFNRETYKLQQPDPKKAVNLFQELEFTSLITLLPKFETVQELKREYHTILTAGELKKLTENLRQHSFVFDIETTGLDIFTVDIVGFSFSWEEGIAYYVPLTAPDTAVEWEYTEIMHILKPIFEDEQIKKSGQNTKFDMSVLRSHGIEVRGVVFDTMIAAYLLDPGTRSYKLDNLSLKYLQTSKIPTSGLIGSGKNQISMADVPLEKIAEYAAEDADHTFRLWQKFDPLLEERGLKKQFTDIEIPLIRVLMDMELSGVSLNVDFFSNMSRRLHNMMELLKQEIFQLTGEEFNISSPKQLGRVLFEKLEIHKEFGVKRVKKTSLGYSTDISILEQFSGNPVVSRILEYRQHAKLLGTYVDALPKLIHPKTGRVHTSFNQTIAATGRLSSSNPNLQNIPIRRELGREIRKAFVARDESWTILSADYSQIELRIMAHLSGDETLREAFNEGKDIHTMTAAKIFSVSKEEVSLEMRYRAKAINFGIMYGMSRFRLAREVNISNEEAQDFITAYFEMFPGVNRYIANQLAAAYKKGYVTTMMGFKRSIPELYSNNQRTRQAAENVAVNTPIQGTAAELIKLAMIRLHARLNEEKLLAQLVLQIHDELVLEVPVSELKTVRQIVRDCMEHTIELSVPLIVDIHTGDNWYEAH